MSIGVVRSVAQVPKEGISRLDGVWRDVDTQTWRIQTKYTSEAIYPGDWIVTEVTGERHVLRSYKNPEAHEILRREYAIEHEYTGKTRVLGTVG